jgi:hypothetical protein
VVLQALVLLLADQVERVVQQVGAVESFLFVRAGGLAEDQGDVHVPSAQHPQPLDRVHIDQIQLHTGVRRRQLGHRPGDDRTEDRLEAGDSHPAGLKTDSGGELDGGRLHPSDDLSGSLGDDLSGSLGEELSGLLGEELSGSLGEELSGSLGEELSGLLGEELAVGGEPDAGPRAGRAGLRLRPPVARGGG